MDAYTGFAAVYDIFMDNIPYEEWCRYLHGLLKEYGVEEGLLLDLFRERKLLEAYVETVALKYDLSMQEIRLLLYLSQSPWEGTRKDLAEILDISRAALTMAVQKLSSRSLVWADGGQTDEKKGGRSWRLTCMDEARPVLADLALARGDFEQACTAGIDPEELARYYATEEKIRNNIRRALQ